MTIILDGTTGITTPAINSSGDLELPGGTANGVLYLNGSKVATSGSALVFDGTNLGVGTSSPNGKIESVNTNSGADTLLLQVRNNATAASTSSSIRFVNSTSSTSTAGGAEVSAIRNANDGGALTFKTAADSTATLTERLRIDSAGNVGIGTSSPNSKFQVSLTDNQGVHFGSQLSDTDEISLGLGYTEGATYNKIKIIANRAYGNGGGDLFFALNSTAGNSNATTSDSRLTIKGDTGNVGIGTSSPGSLLSVGSGAGAIYGGGTTNESVVHINGAGPSSDPVRGQITLSDTKAYNDSPLFIASFAGKFNSSNGYTFFSGIGGGKENTTDGNYAGYLGFYTRPNGGTNTERARITSGGDLLVGTTTTTAKFNITNGSERQISQYINNTNASPVGVQIRYATDINGTSNRFIDCIGDATTRFLVFSNGNVQNTNNSYGSISDEKTKQDIVDAASQWDDIKNVRVRKFRFKNNPDGALQIGVVAQELETVSPGLVDESIDQDGEGNDLGTTTKSVKYSVLYMKAIKALQEAMTRIEALEAEVAALKGAN